MISTTLPPIIQGRNDQTADLNPRNIRNNRNNNNNNQNNNQNNNINNNHALPDLNHIQINQSLIQQNSPTQSHTSIIHTRPSPYNNRFALLRSSPALADTSKTISFATLNVRGISVQS